jgi:hypothetical protein
LHCTDTWCISQLLISFSFCYLRLQAYQC